MVGSPCRLRPAAGRNQCPQVASAVVEAAPTETACPGRLRLAVTGGSNPHGGLNELFPPFPCPAKRGFWPRSPSARPGGVAAHSGRAENRVGTRATQARGNVGRRRSAQPAAAPASAARAGAKDARRSIATEFRYPSLYNFSPLARASCACSGRRNFMPPDESNAPACSCSL